MADIYAKDGPVLKWADTNGCRLFMKNLNETGSHAPTDYRNGRLMRECYSHT